MKFWQSRKVLITGHTGFKGSWLALWLDLLGAEVAGYALAPADDSLWDAARVHESVSTTLADICDKAALERSLQIHQPEVIFHLAAQPLVRVSYASPLETYRVNVLGTATLLDAARTCDSVRAIVVVTTDKCYENLEWEWGYRENDRLGGYDPYSSSKACAELVVSSWRRSYFSGASLGVTVASARAGNVIGGGDWSLDRLIPDAVRAFVSGRTLSLRNPGATRPWQHVLEPLRGYLMLAERLCQSGAAFDEAWNFGPEYRDVRTVESVVAALAEAWGDVADWRVEEAGHPHEAGLLKLDWSKAANRLGWQPALPLGDAIRWTAEWYKSWSMNKDMKVVTTDQIIKYMQLSQYGEPNAHATNAKGGNR